MSLNTFLILREPDSHVYSCSGRFPPPPRPCPCMQKAAALRHAVGYAAARLPPHSSANLNTDLQYP